MYVPPYRLVTQSLGLSDGETNSGNGGWLSDDFLRFMLEKIVGQLPFNEDVYLKANPDVANAIRKGDVASAHEHFIRFGYFEGREGAGPEFHEKWYLKRYPDVAAAVKGGEYGSGWQHYRTEGMMEWRSPSEASEQEIHGWREALSHSDVREIVSAG